MSRIMLVDDDPMLTQLLGQFLRDAGHEVKVHNRPEDALEMLADKTVPRPQLIILDVMMPGIDGFTFHNRLQEDKRTRGIPLIVLTSKGKMSDAFAQSKAVFAFMEKPPRPMELADKVQQAIQASLPPPPAAT